MEEVRSGATAEAPSSGSLLGRREEKKQLSVLPPLGSFCRHLYLVSVLSPSYLLHRNFKFCWQVHTNHVVFPTVTNGRCYSTVKHLSADKLIALELTLDLQVISCTTSGPQEWEEYSFCTNKPFEFPQKNMLELQQRQNLFSAETLAGISTVLAELQEISPAWLARGKRKKKCKRTNKPQRAQNAD